MGVGFVAVDWRPQASMNCVRCSGKLRSAPTRISEVVGDVRALHLDPQNGGALFQAASQFNLLEMTGPSLTPEQGVGIYENDQTQDPACAIACGGGAIFRNYFAPSTDKLTRLQIAKLIVSRIWAGLSGGQICGTCATDMPWPPRAAFQGFELV